MSANIAEMEKRRAAGLDQHRRCARRRRREPGEQREWRERRGDPVSRPQPQPQPARTPEPWRQSSSQPSGAVKAQNLFWRPAACQLFSTRDSLNHLTHSAFKANEHGVGYDGMADVQLVNSPDRRDGHDVAQIEPVAGIDAQAEAVGMARALDKLVQLLADPPDLLAALRELDDPAAH